MAAFAAAVLSPAAAQYADSPFMTDVWTPSQGLPQSRVLSIAQSHDGYLWVGTQLGWLSRFDGIDFRHFNAGNTPALISPEIHWLQVDDSGVLWIADVDGRLISYSNGSFTGRLQGKPGFSKRITQWLGRNPREDLFATDGGMILRLGAEARYENKGNPRPPKMGSIDNFCLDRGELWCKTYGGVLGRWQDGRMDTGVNAQLPEGAKVNFLLGDPAGGGWLATDDGLWKARDGVISRALPGLPDGDQRVLQLAANADGSLWLRTLERMVLVRNGTEVRSYPLPFVNDTPLIRSLEMHVDSKGGVWILKHGAGVWNISADGVLTMLTTRNGLPSDLVETWFEDREKNIWLGTASGLVRLRPRLFHAVAATANTPGTGVVSICEGEDGAIWLGRAYGLTRWQNGEAEDIPLRTVRLGLPLSEITVIPGASAREIWLGTVQSGAMLLRDRQIKHPFPYYAPGFAIRVMRKDPEGGIWFGGEFGLSRWDGKTMKKFGTKDGLSKGHVSDITFDHEGVPWIAVGEKLLVVYREGRFTRVELPGVSSNTRIHTLLCGSDRNVWLGTVGSGLLQLSGGKLIQLTDADGLPSNSVTQLIEDGHGYLWGGTQQGIFRVSTETLDRRARGSGAPVVFQRYGPSDGLPAAECSGGFQPAVWKARDGRLWFSTSNGAAVVDPTKVSRNVVPPTVILEKMGVNDETFLVGQNAEHASRTIPPGQHRYEFFFTGINFSAPDKVGFQWRLDGVDKDWVEGRDQRKVAYSGLGPGDYQFSVRARNNDGVWSKSPAAVSFHVQPYFWQKHAVKTGFLLGGLSLLSLAIFATMRRKHFREMRHLEYEHNLQQQRFRHKQAIASERSRIAAELHDDLGANLTQIRWLTEAVSRVASPPSRENELIERVSSKTYEMASQIDQIVWAVNPKNDTLGHLVDYISVFAEEFFRDSPTRCRIDVASNIPDHILESNVRHHLFLVAKEALHNAAKHAAAEEIWLRVTCDDQALAVVVEDRGRGFDPASAGAGDGLANMRKRALEAEAELEIDSAPDAGTRVTLTLDLTRKTQ